MVVDMYIISPKKDQFKLVFFGLFDFSKMKRPRSRLQKTNKWSFLVLVLFGLSPVQLQSFASPGTGLSNTTHRAQANKSLGSNEGFEDSLSKSGEMTSKAGDGIKTKHKEVEEWEAINSRQRAHPGMFHSTM